MNGTERVKKANWSFELVENRNKFDRPTMDVKRIEWENKMLEK